MKLIRTFEPEFTQKWNTLWQEDPLQHPLAAECTLARQIEYLKENPNIEDHSFIVDSKHGPVMALRLFCERSDAALRMTVAGKPLVYLESKKLAPQAESAFQMLREEFQKNIDIQKQVQTVYLDYLNEGGLSRFSLFLLAQGATASHYFTQFFDIIKDEKALWGGVTESHQQLINWGLSELKLQIFDSKNIELKHLDELKNLFVKTAERELLPPKSWEKQYEWVKSGFAFLVLGYLNGRCVSGSLFLTTQKCAFYSVSAVDYTLSGKPLAYAIFWKGLLHSKSLGCQTFDAGAQIFATGQKSYITDQLTFKKLEANNNLKDLSTFTRGFGGTLRTWLDVTLNSKPQ